MCEELLSPCSQDTIANTKCDNLLSLLSRHLSIVVIVCGGRCPVTHPAVSGTIVSVLRPFEQLLAMGPIELKVKPKMPGACLVVSGDHRAINFALGRRNHLLLRVVHARLRRVYGQVKLFHQKVEMLPGSALLVAQLLIIV